MSKRKSFTPPIIRLSSLILYSFLISLYYQKGPYVLSMITSQNFLFFWTVLRVSSTFSATMEINAPKASTNITSTSSNFSTQQKFPSYTLAMLDINSASCSLPNPKVLITNLLLVIAATCFLRITIVSILPLATAVLGSYQKSSFYLGC